MDAIRSNLAENFFVLIESVPANWIIAGKQAAICDHRIFMPRLNLEFDAKKSPQVIEFIPDHPGIIPWNCSAGMLHGEFDVIDASAPRLELLETASDAPAAAEKVPTPPAPIRGSTYTIMAGDSLRGIAAKFYHDGNRWRFIAEANPGLEPRRLRPGQLIKLPEPISNNHPLRKN